MTALDFPRLDFTGSEYINLLLHISIPLASGAGRKNPVLSNRLSPLLELALQPVRVLAVRLRWRAMDEWPLLQRWSLTAQSITNAANVRK